MFSDAEDSSKLGALAFYPELLRRLTMVARSTEPDGYLLEAEVLDAAAAQFCGTARALRARAHALSQPSLPLEEPSPESNHEGIDLEAFKRCFPDLPAERAREVIAIYEYLTWMAPSLVLAPTILRQEIRVHLEASDFPIERAFALLRFEAFARESAARPPTVLRWLFDEELRAKVLTLGLVEAVRRGLLP